ncbi:MAG: hypothetical protein JWN48_205 [Myxococcaceae bacterium]|nr:hypothetical protein [Myxococcaceae bacterium]
MLGLLSSGCGVFFGDPIELFPDKKKADGGAVDSESPCMEESTPVAGQELTIIDVPASNLAALVEGTRTNIVSWPGVTTTVIHVTVSDPQVFSVRSRINPGFANPHQQSQCGDHVRIDAKLSFKTEDGKLDEAFDRVSYVATDGSQASAVVELLASQLHGTYKPEVLLIGQRCYLGTSFHLLSGPDGTNGAMIDDIRSSCDELDGGVQTKLAGGHWGALWLH